MSLFAHYVEQRWLSHTKQWDPPNGAQAGMCVWMLTVGVLLHAPAHVCNQARPTDPFSTTCLTSDCIVCSLSGVRNGSAEDLRPVLMFPSSRLVCLAIPVLPRRLMLLNRTVQPVSDVLAFGNAVHGLLWAIGWHVTQLALRVCRRTWSGSGQQSQDFNFTQGDPYRLVLDHGNVGGPGYFNLALVHRGALPSWSSEKGEEHTISLQSNFTGEQHRLDLGSVVNGTFRLDVGYTGVDGLRQVWV